MVNKMGLGDILTRISAIAIGNRLKNKDNLEYLKLFCKKQHNTTEFLISLRRRLIVLHISHQY